jgi:hypothetical protein
VELLIDGNANPNLFSSYYGCPLQTAVVNGRADIVEILLHAGAEQHIDEHGWSPRLCARGFKHPQILDMLPTNSTMDSSAVGLPQPSSWSDKHKSSRLTIDNNHLDVIYERGITGKCVYAIHLADASR